MIAAQAAMEKVMTPSAPAQEEEKDAHGSTGAPGKSEDEPAAELAASKSQASKPEKEAASDVGTPRKASKRKKKKANKKETDGVASQGDAAAESVHDTRGTNVAIMNTSDMKSTQSDPPTTHASIPSHPANSTSGANQLTPGAGGGGFGGGATAGTGGMSGKGLDEVAEHVLLPREPPKNNFTSSPPSPYYFVIILLIRGIGTPCGHRGRRRGLITKMVMLLMMG